jgi:2-desacetyl-2-hydroxyethyl bacteriochlorophyllide A dehydrogenase
MGAAMKRKSLIFTAPYQVEIVEEKLPEPGEGEVLVQTRRSAISPGTERLIFEGNAPTDLSTDKTLSSLEGDLSYPLRYGYCVVGYVHRLGPGVDDEWLHQPVFAFHPHSSSFTIRANELIRLPDSLALDDAVFLPNMETAVNFLQDGAPLLGERVVVIGQGIVGLLTTSLLRRTAINNLLAIEPLETRRTLSQEAGAEAAFDPGDKEHMRALDQALKLGSDTGGADLIYELSGNPQALNLAIHCAGFASRIVIGSWYGTKRAQNLDLGAEFHRQRLTLKSSQVSSIEPNLRGRWDKSRRIELVLGLLLTLQPSKWITHRFEITQAADAYKMLSEPGALQIVFTYHD